MGTFKDLTGKVFNRLTVIKFHGFSKNVGHWLCKCSCGNSKIVTSHNLNKGISGLGGVQSCGCLQKDSCHKRRLDDTEAGFRKLLTSYKARAKLKKLPFELDEKHFRSLTKGKCYYCNKGPTQLSHPSKRISEKPYKYNGIDRLKNDQGYVLGNVVSCCGQCNKAKLDLDEEDFLDWIRKVYEVSNSLS